MCLFRKKNRFTYCNTVGCNYMEPLDAQRIKCKRDGSIRTYKKSCPCAAYNKIAKK